MSTPQFQVQPADGLPARAFAPPTAEQLFWSRHLHWLLAPADGKPTLLARAWGVMAVAPLAHITFFSLFYQAYLYDVFHQGRNSRFWHQLCMPIGNLMIMAALMPLWTMGGLDGGALYALILLAWYVAQAIAGRLFLWGLLMVPVVGTLYLGAAAYQQATAGGGIVSSPWLWLGICSLVQTLSHATEPRLPPRVTGTARWRTVREFLAGDGTRPRGMGSRPLRLGAQLLWGTVAELWASPRLLPHGVLAQMRRRGYAAERFAQLDEMTARAIASGEPAVDFIGTGGGAFLLTPSPASGSTATLPRAWRRLFLAEIPLTLGTCVYWAAATEGYLQTLFGAGGASAASFALQSQLTGVVFSLVVWFYGRWLLSAGDIHLRPFRYLQEGFAIGDVFLIVGAIRFLAKGAETPAPWVAQAVMAGLWLAARVVFLVRCR